MMFWNKTAWFSNSVDQTCRKLWRENDGTETDFESAQMIFSSDNTCTDTDRIYNSKDYQNEHLAVFHSRYISDSVQAGSCDKVVLGKYFLPPPDIVALVKNQMTFCWDVPSPGCSVQASSSVNTSRRQTGSQSSRPTSTISNQTPRDSTAGVQQQHVHRVARPLQSPQQQTAHRSPTQEHRRSRSPVSHSRQNGSASATNIRPDYRHTSSDSQRRRDTVPSPTTRSSQQERRKHHSSEREPDVAPVSPSDETLKGSHQKRRQAPHSVSSERSHQQGRQVSAASLLANAVPVNRTEHETHTSPSRRDRNEKETGTNRAGRKRNVSRTQDGTSRRIVVVADVHHSADGGVEGPGDHVDFGGVRHPGQEQRNASADTSYRHISTLAKVTGPLQDFIPGQDGCVVYLRSPQ